MFMVKKGQKQEGLHRYAVNQALCTSQIMNLHKFSALAVAVMYIGW